MPENNPNQTSSAVLTSHPVTIRNLRSVSKSVPILRSSRDGLCPHPQLNRHLHLPTSTTTTRTGYYHHPHWLLAHGWIMWNLYDANRASLHRHALPTYRQHGSQTDLTQSEQRRATQVGDRKKNKGGVPQ